MSSVLPGGCRRCSSMWKVIKRREYLINTSQETFQIKIFNLVLKSLRMILLQAAKPPPWC